MAAPDSIQYFGDKRSDGAVFGQSGGKLAFYGNAPISQQSSLTTIATTAATSTSPYGFTAAQANAILTDIIAIRAVLTSLGIFASA